MMPACTHCGDTCPFAYPRINGQPYCSRDCYEKAMREKRLTR